MGGGNALIDLTLGEASRIDLPWEAARVPDWWIQNGHEDRFALLSDGTDEAIALFDAQTREVTDLTTTTLKAASESVVQAELSPDQSSLLVTINDGGFRVHLVPTDAPHEARLLNGTRFASFSPDGQRILEQRRVDGGQEFALATLEGTERMTLATDKVGWARFVPGSGGELILIFSGSESGHEVVLSDSSGSSRRVVVNLPVDQIPGVPVFSSSGRGALIETSGNVDGWFWVDIEKGTWRERGGLDDLVPLNSESRGARWFHFGPEAALDGAMISDDWRVKAVDLDEGEVFDVFTFVVDAETTVAARFSSSDGRFLVVSQLAGENLEFWLLDTQERVGRRFDGMLGGDFSPDGSRLVTIEMVDAPRRRLVMIDTKTGETTWTKESMPFGGIVWVGGD